MLKSFMTKFTNGLPGYRGFEYQIEATVWVALHMMLEVKRCQEIVVEPKSAEDVEFLVSADETISTVTVDAGPTRRLMLQFKTRSTGPWTKSAFSDVVGDGTPRVRKPNGPAPRPKALEILLEDDSTAYVLVTNASVDSGIFNLATTSLLNSDTKKIPTGILHGSVKVCAPKVEKRIAILHDLTPELIAFRTEDVLSKIGKVPLGQIADCVAALKAQIRRRLLGELPSVLLLKEVKNILEIYGGVSNGDIAQDYFPPERLAEFESALSERNVLVLIGPPGIGKSSLASYLTKRHQTGEIPFAIHRERVSPGQIEQRLQECGPALFVIADPWGISHSRGESVMTHELPRIIRMARHDKRFIITSRNDVYDDVSDAVKLALKGFVLPLSMESYGEAALWRIATRRIEGQTLAMSVVESFRLQILSELKTPAELDLFGKLVSETPTELIEEWAEALGSLVFPDQPWTAAIEVMDLIRDAGQAVSGLYAKQVLSGWSLNQVEHVAASWVLFESFEALHEPELEVLLEVAGAGSGADMRPQRFIAYLKENKIAEYRDERLVIHSFALKGMRDLLDPSREVALAVTERIVHYYVSQKSTPNSMEFVWRARQVIDTWDKWVGRRTRDFTDSVVAVDEFLESRCLNGVGDEFLEAVSTAMWWRRSKNAFVQFVGAWGSSESGWIAPWYPPDLPCDVIEAVMVSGKAAHFLPRFVKEVMPNIAVRYDLDVPAFVQFIKGFKVELGPAARTALDLIYDRMYVDHGEGRNYYDYHDIHQQPADLNEKPLRALLKEYTGECYPDPPAPTPDWDL